MTKDRTYTCEHCGGTFEDGWSEEEAVAEFEQVFPGRDRTDAARLCEDCYQKAIAWGREQGLVP